MTKPIPLLLFVSILLGSIMGGFPIPSDRDAASATASRSGEPALVQVPPEFRDLARCFHQDMVLDASTEAEWIANALRCLRRPQQLVVKQFLTELLSGNPDGQVLQDIWNSTPADWFFPHDEELRGFLAMIRDAIQ